MEEPVGLGTGMGAGPGGIGGQGRRRLATGRRLGRGVGGLGHQLDRWAGAGGWKRTGGWA
jgi:hypothetical protein